MERHDRVLEHERKANVDDLTGLLNRASFNRTLGDLSCDEPGAWAIMILDLDNLKVTNDTFGHHVGDELLRKVSSRLAAASAPAKAFRIGGDEFAIIRPVLGDRPVFRSPGRALYLIIRHAT